MSHWAEINSKNKVIRVVVGDNNDPNGDEGYKWLVDNLGGTWIKTSYNAIGGGFRKNFAGEGYFWDEKNDRFIAPKPFASWTLNEETALWQAPTPYPQDGKFYAWDESTTSWQIAYTQDDDDLPALPPYPSDGNVYTFDANVGSWKLLVEL
jgi:hypothetical protein